VIRFARAGDADLVTALLRAFFSHEGRVVPHLEQNVDAILNDPGRGFFTLGDEKGVVTTTIRISTGGGCSAEIEEVWVQPSARGQGLGRRMLQAAVQECHRRGIGSVELRVSPADQEIGIPDFYAKNGFTPAPVRVYRHETSTIAPNVERLPDTRP
jgi:GNAT superfamily N-acetyltransferase